MASNTVKRISTIPPPTPRTDSDASKDDSTGKKHHDFARFSFELVCPFNIPSSPEVASLRIIKNLGHFALYYTHFVWIALFISLIPQRKVSLIYLVIMTYVASLYLLLLRALPNSYLLHKIINKSIVLGLIAVATMIELIATDAGLHLVINLAATIPIILVHAVLWVREDFSFEGETKNGGTIAGESIPPVNESTEIV